MIIVYHCSDSTPIKIVAGCQTHRPPPHRPLHWVSSCFWDCNAVEFFFGNFHEIHRVLILREIHMETNSFWKTKWGHQCVSCNLIGKFLIFTKRPKISVFLKNGSRLPPSGLLLWLQLGRLLFLLFWGDSAINCDSILKPFPSCPGRPVCTDQYSILLPLIFSHISRAKCEKMSTALVLSNYRPSQKLSCHLYTDFFVEI